MKKFLISVATLFGVGFWPKGPGTWGSLVSLPIMSLALYMGPLFQMVFITLMTPICILSAQFYEDLVKKHDSKEIVIDEFLGMGISLLMLPWHWAWIASGFLLFRFFDILKPFPVGYLDKKINGGVGVVADDVAAGFMANISLHLVNFYFFSN